MSNSGIDTPLRASGSSNDVWRIVWTYTDGAGTAALVKADSDIDPTFLQTLILANGGTGITNVRFPKSAKANVLSLLFIPATVAMGATHLRTSVTDKSATGGTLKVRFGSQANPAVAGNPASGDRVELLLMLSR